MLNPATVLGLWMAFVLTLPHLGAVPLTVAGLLALLALLAVPAAQAHFLRLLRRTRVLLLVLALVYAAATPGQPLMTAWPWMPSMEGVREGVLQAARLVLILASLAWVLARLGQAGLMSGLYAGLKPLAPLGLPVHLFVVRLALVLEQPPPGVRLSPAALACVWESPPAGGGGEVVIELAPFTWRDALAFAAAIVLLVGAAL
ncbi:hypothetical protein [Thiobacter aerophilum]|uniref:Cobalt transporter n=1 Tax=Thiobacter aerophilum TaxID=3121275 RepID=A0ABV0EG92_9BURK